MTRTIVRIAALALATAALAAPTALARPDVTPAPAHVTQFVTRPVVDRNPVSPSSEPVTVSVSRADRGIDWATIGIGVALSLVAVGAISGIANRTRRADRPRIAA
jgi:hypothetical protein